MTCYKRHFYHAGAELCKDQEGAFFYISFLVYWTICTNLILFGLVMVGDVVGGFVGNSDNKA
jgi:hypothetical protein